MVSAEGTVTFPIEQRFGVVVLAKHLNALVSDVRIRVCHLGRWADPFPIAIDMRFNFVEDAALATRVCLDDTAGLPSRSVVET